MSKMAEIHYEIQNMLIKGYDFDTIALILMIPHEWVISVAKNTGFLACQE